MSNLIKINELFTSIQGESTDAGRLCHFVRLQGCNAKCNYCDQESAKDSSGFNTTVTKILEHLDDLKHQTKYVCITGGEPLLQINAVQELVDALALRDFEVSIETNGIAPLSVIRPPQKFKYIMDVKMLSSGESYNVNNFIRLKETDEVKFVVKDIDDLGHIKYVYDRYLKTINPTILISPCMDNKIINKPLIKGDVLNDFLIDFANPKARLQIQMHKALNVR